jgi:hypothetical protein
MSSNAGKIKIIIPVHNDWDCIYLLLDKIKISLGDELYRNVSYLIVDDFSTVELDSSRINPNHQVEIIELVKNMGHQRAIAIGVSYLATSGSIHSIDKIIVMDSDGEDRPEDILTLLKKSNENPGKIFFARRSKRSEGILFKMFYWLFKKVFSMLTSSHISFGNFCIIPASLLKKIVYVSEIWNHFSGGIMRSKIAYDAVPTQRGKRLAGESKMNFVSLFLHGLSAISVYADIMAARIFLLTIILIVLSLGGIIGVSVVRLYTHLAIPGWATFSALLLFIILFQSFFVCLFLIFSLFSFRMSKSIIPAIDYKDYVLSVKKLNA